jgi:hypothetical protein
VRPAFVPSIAAFAACAAPPSDAELDALRAAPAGSAEFASYAGRVPCGDAPEGCQRVKVALTLHRAVADGAPTAYVLEWIHVGVDDLRHTASGTWTERTGLDWDDDARVYELSDGGEHGFDAFLVVQERVLVFLDDDLDVRLGDEGYAYALSAAEF